MNSQELHCGMMVIARDGNGTAWVPTIYGYQKKTFNGETIHICCNGTSFRDCIPMYTNEHLAGTKKDLDMPEPNRFFHEQLVAVKNLEDDDWIPAIFDHVSCIPSDKPYYARLTEHSPVKAYAFCESAIDVFSI